jgi:plastocyanin
MLTTSITAVNPIPAWVESGTTMDVAAALPPEGKAPFTWTWAVGPMLGTAPLAQKATGLDTGSKRADDYMPPGESRSLTFGVPGVYQMHCHPHFQWMRANVTVIDGLAGPTRYDVYVEDGATPHDFRFVPENLTIPTGSVVTYHNVGSQPHTSTLSAQNAPVKLQPLANDRGTITLTGNGWSRVVVIVHDAEGRMGEADYPIYVAPFPATYHNTFNVTLASGAPPQADGVPAGVAASDTKAFKLDYNGTAFVNVTFLDPVAQNLGPTGQTEPASACAGEWHLQEQGATQDTLAGPTGNPSSTNGRVAATTYNLVVTLRQGAQCEAVEDVTVVYDHAPPPVLPYVDPESLPHSH